MDVKQGIWTHYSGSQFEVIGVALGARHYNDDDLVIYRSMRNSALYYRTVEDFLGSETVDGHMIPRFTFRGDN